MTSSSPTLPDWLLSHQAWPVPLPEPAAREDGAKSAPEPEEKVAAASPTQGARPNTVGTRRKIRAFLFLDRLVIPSAASTTAAVNPSSSPRSNSAPTHTGAGDMLRFGPNELICVTDRSIDPDNPDVAFGHIVGEPTRRGRFSLRACHALTEGPPPASPRPSTANNELRGLIRSAVSKKKRRYQRDNYDLDLSYVMPNIVAMGFPSESLEGLYRNPMTEVQSMLSKNHGDRFKVYNLCSERQYPAEKFPNTARFPFDDHNPPNFDLIEEFCADAQNWIEGGEDRTIVLHCKAGKGRTGLMIACFLLHTGIFDDAATALTFYAIKRTLDWKGVTIPSQKRYVNYYQRLRQSRDSIPQCRRLKLCAIHVQHAIVNRDIIFTLHQCNENGSEVNHGKSSQLIGSKSAGVAVTRMTESDGSISLQYEPASDSGSGSLVVCEGDCQLLLAATKQTRFDRGHQKIGQIWFNTRFLDIDHATGNDGKLIDWCVPKSGIDKCCKDHKNKKCPKQFAVTLRFESVEQ